MYLNIKYYQTFDILSLTLILSFATKDPLIEAAEGPTLWSATTLNGDQDMDRTESILKRRWNKIVDGDSENASSHKMNLTVNNSTFNYTTTQEVRTFYNEDRQLKSRLKA